jgi:hypothetical protein
MHTRVRVPSKFKTRGNQPFSLNAFISFKINTTFVVLLFCCFVILIIEPTTSIFGGPDIHVHEGSPVNLSCVVSQAVGQPEFFFWYHNGQVILNCI